MIHDLKKYKEAQIILPHLEKVLEVLSLTERALVFYKSYMPVAKVLQSIKQEKSVLESYRDLYKKIKKTKGSKNP